MINYTDLVTDKHDPGLFNITALQYWEISAHWTLR